MTYGPSLCAECGKPFSPYRREWAWHDEGHVAQTRTWQPTTRCSSECDAAATKRIKQASRLRSRHRVSP